MSKYTMTFDRVGFSELGDKMLNLDLLSNSGYEKITFDLSKLKFVTPSGLCYLIASIQTLTNIIGKENFEIIMPNNNSTNNYLTRMNFLETLGLNDDNYINKNDCSNRLIELQKISMTDRCDWQITENLTNVLESQLPVNNQGILKAVSYAIGEIVDNTLRHSQSPIGGYICAQTYPNKNKLEICIIDCGIGIVESLKVENDVHKEKISKFKSDSEFIQYSIEKGVTSKTQQKFGETGHSGEGLFFTSEFIKENNGRMKVISGNGMLLIDSKVGIQLSETQHHWQGTIVMLEFNLDVPVIVKDIFDREIPLDPEEYDLDDLF